ncbi:MAG: response regulator [Rickettsiales bacterium]
MTLESKNIVAIDDTASIRAFLRVSLEDEGAKVYEASNAREGLELCKKIAPDLVVLDLGLPDMDGLDVLPQIKAMQKDGRPPVVVLTVRKGKKTIAEAYQKGADAYLSKPFMVEDLLELIEDKINGKF